jgi:hypothetical protein
VKSGLIVLMLIAGGSAFAESRFSISIGGGYGPGYYAPGNYAPAPVYRQPARPHVLHRSSGYSNRGWNGAGYWGESPERQHQRAEQYGLHNHQQNERFMYGDSPELWEHQAQEQWELRHEQWHERNGDYGAAEGPAHGSARDGYYYGRY